MWETLTAAKTCSEKIEAAVVAFPATHVSLMTSRQTL
jgi:hypothetical protein